MERIELTFDDSSPLLPLPDSEPDEDEKKRAKEREDNLRLLLGKPGPGDREKLLDEFCAEVQKEVDSLRAGGKVVDISDLLPSVETKPSPVKHPELFRKYKGEWLTAGYVGVVRLRIRENEAVIRFHSRFDPDGGARFLYYVLKRVFELDSDKTSGIVYRDMTVESALGAVFDIMLLRLFFRQLKTALKQGLYRQYNDFPRNDAHVRGRIDLPRHIRENPLQNGRISYVTREYTVDNAVNQLILKAAECLARRYRVKYSELLKENERCYRALTALRGELLDRPPVSARQTVRNAEKKVVHYVYRDYEPLRNTCAAILKHMGVNPVREGASELCGFLLDMPALWEIFLYNAIFRNLDNSRSGYRQNENEYAVLNGRRLVRPDFLFPDKKIVLDAKYKKAWEEAYGSRSWREEDDWPWAKTIREDIFQVVAYMKFFRCETCGVVFSVAGGDRGRRTEFQLDAVKNGGEKTEKNVEEKTETNDGEKTEEALRERFVLLPYFVPAVTEPEDFERVMRKNERRILRFLDPGGPWSTSTQPGGKADTFS